MAYYDKQHVDSHFDTVVETVPEALQDEGFRILCEIDVQEKFEEKLGLEAYPPNIVSSVPAIRHWLVTESTPSLTLACSSPVT